MYSHTAARVCQECQQSVNPINIDSKAASTIDREVQILHQPTIVNQPTEPQLVACHWQLLLTFAAVNHSFSSSAQKRAADVFWVESQKNNADSRASENEIEQKITRNMTWLTT